MYEMQFYIVEIISKDEHKYDIKIKVATLTGPPQFLRIWDK